MGRIGPQTPQENWKSATRERTTAIVCAVSGKNIAKFNLAPDRDFALWAVQNIERLESENRLLSDNIRSLTETVAFIGKERDAAVKNLTARTKEPDHG